MTPPYTDTDGQSNTDAVSSGSKRKRLEPDHISRDDDVFVVPKKKQPPSANNRATSMSTHRFVATRGEICGFFNHANIVNGCGETGNVRIKHSGMVFSISIAYLVITIAERMCGYEIISDSPCPADYFLTSAAASNLFTFFTFPLMAITKTISTYKRCNRKDPVSPTHSSVTEYSDNHPFWSPDEAIYGPVVSHLRDVVCDGDPVSYRAMETWLAELLFSPTEKFPACPIISGPQGAGKNIFFDFVMEFMLGKETTALIADTERIVGRFNVILSNKLLILLSEDNLNKRDSRVIQVLKTLCTESNHCLERKHHDVEDNVTLSTRFILLTNDKEPYKQLAMGERRFFIVRTSPHIRSVKYYENLTMLMKNPTKAPVTAIHFAGYLNAIRRDGIDPRFRPSTMRADAPTNPSMIPNPSDNVSRPGTPNYIIPARYLHSYSDATSDIAFTPRRYDKNILRKQIMTRTVVSKILMGMELVHWFLYGCVVRGLDPALVVTCVLIQQVIGSHMSASMATHIITSISDPFNQTKTFSPTNIKCVPSSAIKDVFERFRDLAAVRFAEYENLIGTSSHRNLGRQSMYGPTIPYDAHGESTYPDSSYATSGSPVDFGLFTYSGNNQAGAFRSHTQSPARSPLEIPTGQQPMFSYTSCKDPILINQNPVFIRTLVSQTIGSLFDVYKLGESQSNGSGKRGDKCRATSAKTSASTIEIDGDENLGSHGKTAGDESAGNNDKSPAGQRKGRSKQESKKSNDAPTYVTIKDRLRFYDISWLKEAFLTKYTAPVITYLDEDLDKLVKEKLFDESDMSFTPSPSQHHSPLETGDGDMYNPIMRIVSDEEEDPPLF
jgi:hypothetical protein